MKRNWRRECGPTILRVPSEKASLVHWVLSGRFARDVDLDLVKIGPGSGRIRAYTLLGAAGLQLYLPFEWILWEQLGDRAPPVGPMASHGKGSALKGRRQCLRSTAGIIRGGILGGTTLARRPRLNNRQYVRTAVRFPPSPPFPRSPKPRRPRRFRISCSALSGGRGAAARAGPAPAAPPARPGRAGERRRRRARLRARARCRCRPPPCPAA